MANSNFFSTLQWEGNSRNMVEQILSSIPIIFRESVKNSIQKWIVRHDVHTVTEDLVFEAVSDIAPGELAREIKQGLGPLRSS